MIPFVLLTTSAFLHALWNAVVKKVTDKDGFVFVSMTISFLLATLASYFLDGFHYGTKIGLIWNFAAGVFEGFYFITLTRSLQTSSLGASYAIMRGGAMLVVWLVAYQFLNEKVSLLGAFGALLVLGGIFFAQDVKFKNHFQVPGFYWPYLCAIFIAGYHLCYDRALHEGSMPMASDSSAMLVATPFLIWQARKNILERSKKILKTHAKLYAFTGVAATASFGIFLWGLSMSAPGFAITLRNTSILFATVFSVMLGDRLQKSQIAGILAIALGATILGLS